MSADCITYHINAENKIVFISEQWHPFARDNMAGVLTSEHVLNKSIFDFVQDSKVKHLYKMLIERSRNEQIAVRLPFRCDSSDTRRYMAMEVYPVENGLIAFRSCILREEKRDSVRLLETDIKRTDDILTICSWCKRVNSNDGTWLEVELAIEKLKLFDENELPMLSHGMCADCYENVKKELQKINGESN